MDKDDRINSDAHKRRTQGYTNTSAYYDTDTMHALERFVTDGNPSIDMGYDLDEYAGYGIQPTYNCQYGYHKWRWYQGFHLEKYWFCETCGEKDYHRDPPPNK